MIVSVPSERSQNVCFMTGFDLRVLLVTVLMAAMLAAGCTTPPPTQVPAPTNTPQEEVAAPSMVDFPARVLGIVVDQDMRVLHVESGSAADQAGLHVGDVLETLNGVPFSDNAERVKELIRSTERVQVTFQRSGENMTLEIIPAPPPGRPNLPTPTPVPPSQDYF